MEHTFSREEIQAALAARHGEAVQKKLSEAAVAVCGLGGLGSAAAVALARIGVGSLHLIDYDRVDLSNIGRQQYAVSQIGMPKPEALAAEIRRIAPYCRVRESFMRLTEQNIPELLADERYICEAFDRAEEKAMLTGCVLEQFPEKYLVGASGMAGIGNSNAIQTRKITEHFYLCGDGISEIGRGNVKSLTAPRVMICAAHQANMIAELITGREV